MKNISLFLITFAIVFLSRAPFIRAGYGIDPDTWRVVNSAQIIASTHKYMASRLPGYPVQETLCSLFWNKGPAYFNGTTAFFSAVGIGLFVLVLKEIGSRDSFFTGIALACTPVVFINSVNSMDYMWALSFVLGSMYCIVTGRPLVAGILLGLAVGCRITSGAMALPFSMMFFNNHTEKKLPLRQTAKFLTGTFVISTVAFFPVFQKYGFGFFTFNDGYPSVFEIIRNTTIETWGIIGFIALTVMLAVFILQKESTGRMTSISQQTPRSWILAWTIAIALSIIAFLLLPGEAGYLLSMLPFVFLLFARFLNRKIFIAACTGIIFSSFFVSVDSIDRQWSVKPSAFSVRLQIKERELAFDLLNGPIINDHFRRNERIKFVDRLLSFGKSRTTQSVIVAGVWLPQLVITAGGTLSDNTEKYFSFTQGVTHYVGLLDEATARRYQEQKYNLFYVQGQEKYNAAIFDVNLVQLGAQEIQTR